MSARDARIAAALRELGALVVEGDDRATAWLLAIDWKAGRFVGLDTHAAMAVRRLALALHDGALDAAADAARWITAPDDAMEVACPEARLRAQTALLGWRNATSRVTRDGAGWRATVQNGSAAWITQGATAADAADAMLAYLPAPVRRVA